MNRYAQTNSANISIVDLKCRKRTGEKHRDQWIQYVSWSNVMLRSFIRKPVWRLCKARRDLQAAYCRVVTGGKSAAGKGVPRGADSCRYSKLLRAMHRVGEDEVVSYDVTDVASWIIWRDQLTDSASRSIWFFFYHPLFPHFLPKV